MNGESRNRAARTISTTALAALAPAAVATTRWAVDGRVPDPLPTHWDLHGRVDDVLALDVLFGVCLAVSAALAALVGLLVARSREDRADRLLVAATVWSAWLAALVVVVPALASYDAADARDVTLSWWWLAVLPGVAVLAAVVAWWLQPVTLRPRRAAPRSGGGPGLREGERVTWVGRSTSPVLVGLAGVLVLVAVYLVFTVWPVANVAALVALAVWWSHVVTVRVDERAVTTSWGPARWPRLSVPLDEVDTARAEEVEPRLWGGWGYRVSRRGRAVVTRRGPGLVLELRDGSALAVTVDGADEAAELVTAMVERQLRSRR
jgi:hypothetical protein